MRRVLDLQVRSDCRACLRRSPRRAAGLADGTNGRLPLALVDLEGVRWIGLAVPQIEGVKVRVGVFGGSTAIKAAAGVEG